jgi:pyruvate/2-oxoglutarate dehydrogenase complex dihydrolipoamide dehydrogenase (E3) component
MALISSGELLRREVAAATEPQEATHHGLTSTPVNRVESSPGGVRVSLRDGDAAERALERDVLLVSVRRRPVTDRMGFATARSFRPAAACNLSFRTSRR